MKVVAAVILLLFAAFRVHAQSPFEGYEMLFTEPAIYTARFTQEHITIDGNLRERAWQQAPWTAPFVDIEGSLKPAPALRTRAKMLWNDSLLFIAAELEEPHVWATLRQHDDIIYHDNDFEIFIDPDNNTHQYFEIELNAFNTVFDLFMPKPYRNGAGAMIPYDVRGLRTAVRVRGTINQPADRDSGWTVELAIPFRALMIGNTRQAPPDGAFWRINFSRVQWDTDIVQGKYVKRKDNAGKTLPEHNWVWSPQGVINMHFPERWGYLRFVRDAAAAGPEALPPGEAQRKYLWLIYYRQKAFFSRSRRYADSLASLQMDSPVLIGQRPYELRVEATTRQFMAYISDGKETWSINEEGYVQKLNR